MQELQVEVACSLHIKRSRYKFRRIAQSFLGAKKMHFSGVPDRSQCCSVHVSCLD